MTREPIYAALFAKVAASAGFVTTRRRLAHWTDVQALSQPALYMAQTGESARVVRGQDTIWTLDVELYIYVRAQNQEAPGPLLNPLLDAVCTALAPNTPDNVQTLGGLVQHCWIEGDIKTDEGTLGEQGVAIVPVRILTT